MTNTDRVRLYKVLGPDGTPIHGGRGRWVPGKWRSVRGPLVPCEHGLHLVSARQLIDYLGPEIWRAETDGELINAINKYVARQARITTRVEAWNECSARQFAADCAEHVLEIFEGLFPGDDRPREAIAACRRYAEGTASLEEASVASYVAYRAAEEAFEHHATARAAHAAYAAARASIAPITAVEAAYYAVDTRAAGAERGWQSTHLIALLGLEDDA